MEGARCFWKSPFLFMDTGNVIDRQKNILQAEALLTEALTTAVRGLLPVKQILKDYMDEDQEEIEDEPVKPVKPAKAEEQVKSEEVVPTVSEPVTPSSPERKEVSEPVREIEQEIKSILKIDTEPSVKFSEYDTVFDDTKETPELRPVKDIEEGVLNIDEKSITGISQMDVEDLEPEIPMKTPAKDPVIEDSEVVVLE
jgi:hypothetical protein